jgi:hypothetical protein
VSLPTKLNSYKKNDSGDILTTSDTKQKLYQPSFRFWCKEFKIKELYITSSKISENPLKCKLMIFHQQQLRLTFRRHIQQSNSHDVRKAHLLAIVGGRLKTLI